MLCHLQRPSRESRFTLVGLIRQLYTFTGLLSNMGYTADEGRRYLVEIAVSRGSQVALQLLKLSSGRLYVDTILLNAEHSLHFCATLYHQQPPRHL